MRFFETLKQYFYFRVSTPPKPDKNISSIHTFEYTPVWGKSNHNASPPKDPRPGQTWRKKP